MNPIANISRKGVCSCPFDAMLMVVASVITRFENHVNKERIRARTCGAPIFRPIFFALSLGTLFTTHHVALDLSESVESTALSFHRLSAADAIKNLKASRDLPESSHKAPSKLKIKR